MTDKPAGATTLDATPDSANPAPANPAPASPATASSAPPISGSASSNPVSPASPISPPTHQPRRRFVAWMVVACALAGAGYLLYRTLDNASLFFLSVERAVEQRDSLGSKRFQLHGTPVPQSIYTIERNGQTRVIFNLAGNETTVRISHTGDPPDLFQPCVPVVLHGNWQAGEIPGDSRPAGNQSAANQSAGGQVVDDQPAGNVIAGGEPGTAAGDAAGAIAEFHFESDRILVKHDNEYRQQDSVYPSGADPNSPDPASPDPGKLAASNYNSNHGVATLARLCPNS